MDQLERYPQRGRRSACVLLASVAAVFLGGCQRALFDAVESNRTQFETYDAMRGEFVPVSEPDVFGNPQPALRARLLRD